jgi:hypothetical protein
VPSSSPFVIEPSTVPTILRRQSTMNGINLSVGYLNDKGTNGGASKGQPE